MRMKLHKNNKNSDFISNYSIKWFILNWFIPIVAITNKLE